METVTVTLKCQFTYLKNGQKNMEEYTLNGKRHNSNGYALRSWNTNGVLWLEKHYLYGQSHNSNGVAHTEWFNNGQLRSQIYIVNGKLHNPNGVARRLWHKNGEVLSEQYYLDDEYLSKEEFNNRNKVKSCDDKVVEVDGVKYKLKAI